MLRGTREGSIARRLRLVLSALVMLAAAAFSGHAAFAAADGMNALSAKDMQTLSAFKKADTPNKVAKAKKRSVKKAKLAAKTKVRKSRKHKATKLAHKKTKHAKKHRARVASAKATSRKGRVKKGGGSLNGGVAWNAPSGCVPGRLKSVLAQVSQKYGRVVVNSSARGSRHNRKVGGARASWHLKCMAVDFRVHGSTKGLWGFLRSHPGVGGLHRYPSGFFHIDAGPKRTW